MVTRDEGTALAVPEPVASSATEIDQMMALAADKGTEGVEVLERLVHLKFRLMDRDAETAMNYALARFKDECPPIPKSRRGKSFTVSGVKSYTWYAGLEEIQAIIDPLVVRLGLSYVFDFQPAGDRLLSGTISVGHVDGVSRRYSMVMPTGSDADSFQGARTRLKRLLIADAFGIRTEDRSDDSEIASGETLTDEQLADLSALDREVGLSTIARAKMLEILGVAEWAELDQAQYPVAVRMVESKRR